MSWKYIFTASGKKSLSKLPKHEKERIISKLIFFSEQWNPLSFARKLKNSKLGSYRFRIWEYRVIFDIDEQGRIIIIALIGSRKDIYK